jgi:hypothetical protein
MSDLQTVEHEHEVLVPLDEAKAKALDGRIRRLGKQAADQLVQVGRLLDEAQAGQIHVTLGFPSWPAYVSDALGGQLQLSPDSRKAMVALMAGQGMSERDTATAVSASKTTVHRDLDEAVHNGPPESDAPAGSPEPAATVTHTHDGKQFKRKPKPKPKGDKPRRRPNVRKGFEYMALQVGVWADGLKDMDPAELVVDEKVQKEIDAVVDGIAAIRKFVDGVKPARQPQVLTVFRAKVKELSPVITGLEELTTDPRWPKAVDRFKYTDRIEVGKAIRRLQKLHAQVGGPAPAPLEGIVGENVMADTADVGTAPDEAATKNEQQEVLDEVAHNVGQALGGLFGGKR